MPVLACFHSHYPPPSLPQHPQHPSNRVAPRTTPTAPPPLPTQPPDESPARARVPHASASLTHQLTRRVMSSGDGERHEFGRWLRLTLSRASLATSSSPLAGLSPPLLTPQPPRRRARRRGHLLHLRRRRRKDPGDLARAPCG